MKHVPLVVTGQIIDGGNVWGCFTGLGGESGPLYLERQRLVEWGYGSFILSNVMDDEVFSPNRRV